MTNRHSSPQERQLLQLHATLGTAEQETLLAFAAFLASRQTVQAPIVLCPEPTLLAAPPGESVIGAIKRLSASYPMLDKKTLLHETASLMSQHVMQGRAAAEVITELELLFLQRYQQTRSLVGLSDESDR
jgi:hypothetical protein